MHNIDNWFIIFMMVVVMTIGSCTAYDIHNDTIYRIAKLECQQEVGDE